MLWKLYLKKQTVFRTSTRVSWNTTQLQLSLATIVPRKIRRSPQGTSARKVDERYTPSLPSSGALTGLNTIIHWFIQRRQLLLLRFKGAKILRSGWINKTD